MGVASEVELDPVGARLDWAIVEGWTPDDGRSAIVFCVIGGVVWLLGGRVLVATGVPDIQHTSPVGGALAPAPSRQIPSLPFQPQAPHVESHRGATVGVLVGVLVGVCVGVLVRVGVGVRVRVDVGMGVCVFVGVGVDVFVGVRVGVGVPVSG